MSLKVVRDQVEIGTELLEGDTAIVGAIDASAIPIAEPEVSTGRLREVDCSLAPPRRDADGGTGALSSGAGGGSW